MSILKRLLVGQNIACGNAHEFARSLILVVNGDLTSSSFVEPNFVFGDDLFFST